MQISRHWRLNPLRYRLEGVRYENGQTSLQNRPQPLHTDDERETGEYEQVQVEAEHEIREPVFA